MKTILIVAAVLVLAVALGSSSSGTLVQRAPATAARLKNPLQGDSESERAGEKLYARECASCHGLSREGRGAAPPLNRPEVFRAAPGALFWVLRNGSLRRGMPSFAHLPETERWQIIAYLQRKPNQ